IQIPRLLGNEVFAVGSIHCIKLHVMIRIVTSAEDDNTFCFPFSAICVNVDMGLFASDVLLAFPRLTFAY
ncbi:MAG: hypothetical protein ACKPKO_22360, partial [Candidatus Fonsibacter sp.]